MTPLFFFQQISFTNGKSRGYSIESFDWSKSTLSKLLHSKQASTVEMFVEVWKTDIQPHSNDTAVSNNRTTPLSNSTSLSTARAKTTSSRKRTAADAHLHQHSSTPPALRPVHIVNNALIPEVDSDSTQLDEAIEKGFVGMNNDNTMIAACCNRVFLTSTPYLTHQLTTMFFLQVTPRFL